MAVKKRVSLTSQCCICYLRTRAAADAIKFTVDQQDLEKRRASKAGSGKSAEPKLKQEEELVKALACSLDNKDECLACGS